MDVQLEVDADADAVVNVDANEMKLPQVNKNTRFYYRHREEIAAARKERLLADPVYVAKQAAKEAARVEKETAKIERLAAKQKAKEDALIAKEELKKQKRDIKAKLVGATSTV
jgi:muconolactone delta-isomerase